jgi:hypothetical protein
MVGSRITTISLDEESAKIAKTLPNFSHFVRECLFRYASNKNVESCTREKWIETELCNPFVQPVCFSCWPNGAPPREAVKQFRADGLSLAWLQEQARYHNRGVFDISGVNTLPSRMDQDKKKSPSKVGFFAQIRRKYRGKLK